MRCWGEWAGQAEGLSYGGQGNAKVANATNDTKRFHPIRAKAARKKGSESYAIPC
jgi:hypothetical protein